MRKRVQINKRFGFKHGLFDGHHPWQPWLEESHLDDDISNVLGWEFSL